MTQEQQIDDEYEQQRAETAKRLFDGKAYLLMLLSKKGSPLTENEIELEFHLRKDEQLKDKIVYQ